MASTSGGYTTHRTEEIRFRNPIQRHGFAIVYHVLTLDKTLSDGAFRLYALLLKYAQQKNHAYPGVQRLADDLGTSERTIKSRLAELEQPGLITRQRRFGKSSITWIEDLTEVYANYLDEGAENCPFDQTCEGAENCPTATEQMCEGAENCPSNGQNSAPKEQEEKNNKNDDGGLDHKQEQALHTLLALNVTESVARRLAQTCDPDMVEGWCEYAQQAGSALWNPAAFVVAKLRAGDVLPEQRDDPDRYISGEYAEFIEY